MQKHILESYQASDRRVYKGGALCSDMQYAEDRTTFIHKRLVVLLPGALVTYFPMEGKYHVCDTDNAYKSVIGDLIDGKQEATLEAIRILTHE